MKQVLGIDVGGTKIAAGLVDKFYKVTKAKIHPTSQVNLVDQLIDLIKSYEVFDGIGIAMPGPISTNGYVQKLPNVPHFKPINIKKLIKNRFKVPVSLNNDAKAFTLAEAMIGSGKAYKTVVGIILGTGIGSGLVQSKKIHSEKLPFEGEIGHILIDHNLTLERMMQRSKSEFKSHKQAEKIVRIILSMIIGAVEPDIIIFGGGRTNYRGMNKILKQNMNSDSNPRRIKLVLSKLKFAGVIGAALPLLKR